MVLLERSKTKFKLNISVAIESIYLNISVRFTKKKKK